MKRAEQNSLKSEENINAGSTRIREHSPRLSGTPSFPSYGRFLLFGIPTYLGRVRHIRGILRLRSSLSNMDSRIDQLLAAPPGIYTVAPNGRTYASHEIGNTLFLLPVAGLNVVLEKALANRYDTRRIGFVTSFLANLMPAVYCSLAIALFYTLLRVGFRQSITAALASSMASAFCTFVWSYSRILSDVVLCMCLLTGAMYSIMQFKRTLKTYYFWPLWCSAASELFLG